jgi:hypothetical protein
MRFVEAWVVALWLPALACGNSDGAPGDGGITDGTVPRADARSPGRDAGENDAESDASSSTDGAVGDGATSDAGAMRPPLPDAGLAADWCREGDRALSQAVLGLEPGQWAELPANESLAGLDFHGHLFSWSDTGVWNPVHKSVQWVGSPGSCCADPATFVLVRYDVATDTWTMHETPWNDHSGHAYDASAVDPETGIHYFARAEEIGGFDQTDWSILPSLPFSGVIAPALTFFRGLDGEGALLYVSRGRLAKYDGAEWAQVDLGDIEGWGNFTFFAEYNPVHDVVWMGSGNEGERIHYRLDDQLQFTRLEDAPIDLRASGASLKTYDPVSGTFIVYRKHRETETHTFYTYDVRSDEWTDVTAAMDADLPESWSDQRRSFVVPIDDCGVLLYFTHYFDERHVYVYRHR